MRADASGNAADGVLALFDLDGTLLAGDCDEMWVDFLIDKGALDRVAFQRANRSIGERYRRGEVGSLEFTEFYLATLQPHSLSRLEAWRTVYLRERILPAIPRVARELVERHRTAGHLVVLTTAASSFLTTPIAREFGFEHLIATKPELRDGRYTGKVDGTPNMREGKVSRLEAWLAQRGQRLGQFRESWFYTDSRNDIPLLSVVTHPVAVNPDPTLAQVATEKHWATLQIG